MDSAEMAKRGMRIEVPLAPEPLMMMVVKSQKAVAPLSLPEHLDAVYS
jgi:hypothetical protein